MPLYKKQPGFTIVELLIVVVVIAILAAITIVSYNGIQTRTFNTRVVADMRNVHRIIEAYNVTTGNYPSTGSINTVRMDSNCIGGVKSTAWVPGVSEKLPQSQQTIGVNGFEGCYMYASDGVTFVLSAWNGVKGEPQNSTMYRRVGFREMGNINAMQYYCNHLNIGGGATYSADMDYYKRSYTISNITACNETPPAGAL